MEAWIAVKCYRYKWLVGKFHSVLLFVQNHTQIFKCSDTQLYWTLDQNETINITAKYFKLHKSQLKLNITLKTNIHKK